jgi:hypothetical protein
VLLGYKIQIKLIQQAKNTNMTEPKNAHKLSEEQRRYFDKLTEKRKNLIQVLQENGIIEPFVNLIVDTYRDSAHFVYELLQNADDTEATSVRFILDKKGLFFSHNGKVPFSVSDPDFELNSKAGHINAITTFSLSNKTSDASKTENKIGKFGIGFKSVFQYTSTPQIYNPPFLFEIQEYMIPVEIDTSYQEWLDDKGIVFDEDETTAFYLPFNSNDTTRDQAYEDIRKKLEGLNNPLLFLNHLQKIQWQTLSNEGSFTKSIETNFQEISNLYSCELTKVRLDENFFYVFSRLSEFGYKYSIAYPLDKNGNVDSSSKYNGYTAYAYCFFATKQETKAKFLIHAPFILTPNREGIKENKKENEQLINQLAKLSVDSILICKKLQLINDQFFNILPINHDYFGSKDNIFMPIYQAIRVALRTQEILPVNDGKTFVRSSSAYWADSRALRELLSYNNFKPLRDLYNDQSAQLVFSTVAKGSSSSLILPYITKDGDLVRHSISSDNIISKLNEDFILKQDFDWLIKMYNYFADHASWLLEKLKKQPIIILEDWNNRIISPFSSDNKCQVFLSTNPPHSRNTVHKYFEENANNFLLRIGIRQPNELERVEDIINTYRLKSTLEQDGIESNKTIKNLLDEFETFIEFYKQISHDKDKKYNFLNDLRKEKFLVTNQSIIDIKSNSVRYLSKPCNDSSKIYLPNEDLIQYFAGYEDIKFFNKSFYSSIYDKYEEEFISLFLKELGVSDKLIPARCSYDSKYGSLSALKRLYGYKHSEEHSVTDYSLEGLDNALSNINIEVSRFIFITLKSILRVNTWMANALYISESNKSNNTRTHEFPAKFIETLKNTAWLYDSDNNLLKPSEIFLQDLSNIYDLSDSSLVIEKLGIPSRPPMSMEEIERDFGFNQRELFEILKREKVKKQEKAELQVIDENISPEIKQRIENTAIKLVKGASRNLEQPKSLSTNNINNADIIDVDENDEFSPSSIDIHKEIKAINEATEQKIAEITRKTQLEETVENSEKYTFAWFEALLELEYSYASEDQVKKNPLQVIFKKVEREANTENTIILSETSYIPNRLEDVGDLQLVLNFKNKEHKSVQVEVLSPQKRILRAKLKDITALDGMTLDEVESAVIEVKNADFILENLRNSFIRLPFADDDNLQEQLPKNIEFVFGPPGTGKTTHLVRKEILPRINSSEVKILVLF